MPECPDSIEEFEDQVNRLKLCRVTLYNQARARIETGAAKSVSEASRQLAEEMGKSPETIRRRINEAQHNDLCNLAQIAHTDNHRPFATSQKLVPTEIPMPRVALGEKEILEAAREIQSQKREAKREVIIQKLESIQAIEAKEIQGVYDVIVIDPPWPMQKIERDERPNQSEFGYPVMTESELNGLSIPAAEDCHVWLWSTHKFLPMAFRLLDQWDLKYVCLFTWHKPGGFQPFGLPQFNSEFAIYSRKGAPQFIDTKDFPTCFTAGRGAHSEKPEEFYDMVRRVTAGRRIDLFNRRKIEGFEGWGKEAA